MLGFLLGGGGREGRGRKGRGRVHIVKLMAQTGKNRAAGVLFKNPNQKDYEPTQLTEVVTKS